MCFSIHNQKSILKLVAAAQYVQQIIDDGILPEAFNRNKNGEAHTAVVAFDTLAKAAAQVAEENKQVSPFIHYRKEILGEYETAARLRALVMNLWGGRQHNLGLLFMHADPHHTRIALECIASYTRLGENDPHFMALANSINQQQNHEEAA